MPTKATTKLVNACQSQSFRVQGVDLFRMQRSQNTAEQDAGHIHRANDRQRVERGSQTRRADGSADHSYAGTAEQKPMGTAQETGLLGPGLLFFKCSETNPSKTCGLSQAFLLEVATFQLRGLAYSRGKLPTLF